MSTALGILAAEIVKKVIGGHGPNLHDCACACGLPVQRIEHPNLPLPLFFDFDAHRAHVAEAIVAALGNQLAPDGFVVGHCARRGEPILVPRTDPTNEAMLLCDPCNAELIRDAQAATTPQAHVRGQERPKPANVGTGEGAGLEGAQIGAREIKPERPREGE